jgi:hypothetical protein
VAGQFRISVTPGGHGVGLLCCALADNAKAKTLRRMIDDRFNREDELFLMQSLSKSETYELNSSPSHFGHGTATSAETGRVKCLMWPHRWHLHASVAAERIWIA